jgi:hypothetical protein
LNLRDAALHQQCLWLEHVISRPWPNVIYAVLVVVVLWAALTYRSGSNRYAPDAVSEIAVAMVCILWIPVLRMQARALRSRLNSSQPFCAECGYDLSGTPVGDDGGRICSECSAAWKLRVMRKPLNPRVRTLQVRSRRREQ